MNIYIYKIYTSYHDDKNKVKNFIDNHEGGDWYFIQQKENFVNKKDVKKIKTNNLELTKLLNKYNLFFQYPARTEEICNIQNKHKSNYIGMPWATIIDKNMLPVMFRLCHVSHYWPIK